jgi:hypothetical protein
MTGNEILQRALALLGYAENNGNSQLPQRVLQKALPIVNLVYSDIKRMCGIDEKPLESLENEIKTPDKATEVFVCGVASYIAATEGDDAAQAFWSLEYSTRKTTHTRTTQIVDSIPVPEC